ncbi:MAG: glycosyltransferase family 4 protein [Desulfuromonadaceae bacterium]|nr:glycosyltransferase family 4 protein [Desulfuromonadaceae bacterium]MDD2848968.1 glycosyltransferase family 4 protein [Desulfuromonadaceae bacterium]MDD4130317.1 glycosyltransferase family 4 protein [Desulfuromonadaceae bacterium]
MKKVLLIAYYFPPDFAVGGQRIAKFARNLPTFGWEPTVLTIADCYRDQLDKERVHDLGNTRVIKTMKVPKFTDLLLYIKRITPLVFKNKKSDNRAYYVGGSGGDCGNVQSETLIQKLKRYYISFSYLPDGERSWIIPATLKALVEIKRLQIKCIMTSSPPHSSHIVGLIIKKLFSVKWIADFRDPWIDFEQYRAPEIRSALSDKIESWLEGKVVRNADKILTTTNEHRLALMRRFPAEPVDKFVYVSNGIDMEKFQIGSFPDRYETFTISYTGTMYLKRSPEPLFKAIQKLISTDMVKMSAIRFKIFGNCELIEGKTVAELAREYGIDSIVEVSPPIPLNEAIDVMKSSHLLLLLVTSIQDINIPAKIYDYFGSRTRILAITEPGATSELIKNTESGAVFIPGDTDGIAEYIYEQCSDSGRNHIRNNPHMYAQFDTKVLTEKLATELSLLLTST